MSHRCNKMQQTGEVWDNNLIGGCQAMCVRALESWEFKTYSEAGLKERERECNTLLVTITKKSNIINK